MTLKEYLKTLLQGAKTYVDEKVAGLVDSAPDTLNTIGELATALQENKEVVDVLLSMLQ